MSKRRRVVLKPDVRRQQLVEAATSVFATRGYRSAGVSDIIQAAGVARGTFYLYFEGKAQIFMAIADDFYDRLEQVLDKHDPTSLRAGTSDARAALGASFSRWFEFFHLNREAATVILKDAPAVDPRFDRGIAELRQTALAYFANRVRRFQELHLVRASLSPDIVAHLQIGMFEELVKTFVLDTEQPDLEALADHMADFGWSGIAPER
jgi:AcrR family transcriptional regulator